MEKDMKTRVQRGLDKMLSGFSTLDTEAKIKEMLGN